MPIVLASPLGAAVLGGRPFDPANIATLQVRLDFDDISSLYQTDDTSSPVTVSGQSIGRITNKGALGGAFIQATGTARPTYGTFNGSQLGATFDGGDSLVSTLAASNFRFMHNGTRYVVMAHLKIVTPASYCNPIDSGGVTGYAIYMLSTRSVTHRILAASASPVSASTGSAAFASGTPFTLSNRYQNAITGNDSILRIDGTQVASAETTSGLGSGDSGSTLTIGKEGSGSLGHIPNGSAIRRIWIWELPSNYPDDWIPTAEAAIAL